MKLSDYVVDFLANQGTRHAFVVTGGAVVHLLDSVSKHPKMEHVCIQHEQSGAAAADGYFRASGRLGVAMTTSGPGATNLLTSVCNAFFDSVPLICLTGQVARFRLRPNQRMRQRGFQETDICLVYQSVCKYVVLVTDPQRIRYELEKAVFLAQEGRPGPVVVDIPDDLQREEIDPESLPSFVPEKRVSPNIQAEVQQLGVLIRAAKRPVLILGGGVHAAGVEREVIAFARHFHLPLVLTWGATDLLPYTDPLNCGGVGVCGPRGGNFALQSADLVLAMGTRLSQMITGGKQNLFAPLAKKVMVDIDLEELNKFRGQPFALDLPIHTDLTTFFKACDSFYTYPEEDRFQAWRSLIHRWRARYPLCTDADAQAPGRMNPYVFVKAFSRHVKEGATLVTDTGANICWIMQAFEVKAGQRIFSAWNHTPMGYALPASIGAAFATGKEILCLIGDGGLMMCLAELATVSRYQLPIKIIIFDNEGHATMRQTLDIWLKSNYVAVDRASGLSFPDYERLAAAFELPYMCLRSNEELKEGLPKMFEAQGPLVCHLEIDVEQKIVPMLRYGAGLEDLDPRLEEDEKALIRQEWMELAEQEVCR